MTLFLICADLKAVFSTVCSIWWSLWFRNICNIEGSAQKFTKSERSWFL